MHHASLHIKLSFVVHSSLLSLDRNTLFSKGHTRGKMDKGPKRFCPVVIDLDFLSPDFHLAMYGCTWVLCPQRRLIGLCWLKLGGPCSLLFDVRPVLLLWCISLKSFFQSVTHMAMSIGPCHQGRKGCYQPPPAASSP